MGFHLANDLQQAVEATACKMQAEHLNMCAIPDTPGMTLYKLGSKEYEALRKKYHPRAPFMPIPVTIKGCVYLVCIDQQSEQPCGGSDCAADR